jgi:hypothetical protein
VTDEFVHVIYNGLFFQPYDARARELSRIAISIVPAVSAYFVVTLVFVIFSCADAVDHRRERCGRSVADNVVLGVQAGKRNPSQVRVMSEFLTMMMVVGTYM